MPRIPLKRSTSGSYAGNKAPHPLQRNGSPEARALMTVFPAIDLHADTLMWTRWVGYDLLKRHQAPLPGSSLFGHVDAPRLADGHVGGQFFGIVTLPVLGTLNAPAAFAQIDALAAACQKGGRLRRGRSAEDVERAAVEDTTAAFLGVEGAHALDGCVGNVARFARRGVRYLGLAHFSANDACRPRKGIGMDPDDGLSDFGRDVIAACEAEGVIVDLAHINGKGFREACAVARKPVIVSHTGIGGAHAHWRNLDDDQLRAVANSGGVVGIMFAPAFLGGNGIDAVLRHMQHVIAMVGEDHVALGSDYDGMIVPTHGLEDISMLPNLTDAMLHAGWAPERIGKILRGNVLRVLREVPPVHP